MVNEQGFGEGHQIGDAVTRVAVMAAVLRAMAGGRRFPSPQRVTYGT